MYSMPWSSDGSEFDVRLDITVHVKLVVTRVAYLEVAVELCCLELR